MNFDESVSRTQPRTGKNKTRHETVATPSHKIELLTQRNVIWSFVLAVNGEGTRAT